MLGDAIAANLFLLGFAFQKGSVPLSSAALLKAIEINGVAVKANQAAFDWGRRAAMDLRSVTREAMPASVVSMPVPPRTLEALIEERSAFLSRYQDARYAGRYTEFVRHVQEVESRHGGKDSFTKAVAANLFKLMAYKDEYEVARLYTDEQFHEQVAREFEGRPVLRFHLAPPILGRKNAAGHPLKSTFGPWMMPAFRVLAAVRRLRGTSLDPFGWSAERREERRLIEDYRTAIEEILARWEHTDPEAALALARLPEQIRGYGHVKQASIDAARVRWRTLDRQLVPEPSPVVEPAALAH